MAKSGVTVDGDSLAETQTETSAKSKFPYLERLARLGDNDHRYFEPELPFFSGER